MYSESPERELLYSQNYTTAVTYMHNTLHKSTYKLCVSRYDKTTWRPKSEEARSIVCPRVLKSEEARASVPQCIAAYDLHTQD